MSVSEWTPEQVLEWLKGLPVSIGYDVSAAFLSNCVDGGYLLQLDHAKLTDLKVVALGHREIILACISKLSSMFRDHHSERCQGLALEVISQCSEVRDFLTRLQDMTTVGDEGDPTAVKECSGEISHCNIGSMLCDLLRSSRNLAIWLDMNRVNDYTSDYAEFRQVLLKTALFLATKFQDPDTPHDELFEKCSTLSTLATSLKDCLDETDLGSIRPAKAKVVLASAADNPRGWGFSIKAMQGSIFINSLLPDTPATACGNLFSRDELIEVNGCAITSWVFENVTAKLRQVPKSEPLPLTVLRGVVPSAGSICSGDGTPAGGTRAQFRLLPDTARRSPLLVGKKDSGPVAFREGSFDSLSGDPTGVTTGNGCATVAGEKSTALFDALNKQANRDDEGSSDGSSEDEDDIDEDEVLEIAQTTVPSNGGGVKTSQSEMAVSSQKPHPGLERNNPSLPSVQQGPQFGYRTQIVGGVVMRIPVSGPNDASPKPKAARKQSKSMLQFFTRKTQSVSSQDQVTRNSFKGFGSADMKPSTSGKAVKREIEASASVGTIADRKIKPLDRVLSDQTVTTSSSHPNLKKRSSQTTSGRGVGISRMLDKETIVGDCNIPVVALKSPECQGWMTKKGNVKRNWKRRWFVLKGLCLYYYRTPQDDAALNVIPLPSYDVEIAPDSKKAFALRLAHKNARTFHMYCDTFEDMVMWMEALKTASTGASASPRRSLSSEDLAGRQGKTEYQVEVTESTGC